MRVRILLLVVLTIAVLVLEIVMNDVIAITRAVEYNLKSTHPIRSNQ